MPLLIDGYNLLHVSGILGRDTGAGSLHESRLALLNFLAESLDPDQRSKTTIVFDAQDPPWGLLRTTSHRGIQVRFASTHDSADALIEELIQADFAPRQLTVVSSDHRVQRAARRRRAKAVDSDVWYLELRRQRQQRDASADVAPARPPVPLLEEDVNYWVRQFGGESALIEFIERESESAAPPIDPPTKPPRTKKAHLEKKPAKRAADKKPSAKKRTRKPRCRDRGPASKELRATDIVNLANPFPPGYGEDLLEGPS